VLEQLAAVVLQLRHDRGHVTVLDDALLLLPPLPDVVEEEDVALDSHMVAADGAEAVGRVVLRRLVVADPEEALVHQPDDGGDDALAVELFAFQVVADAAAQLGKRLAEFDDLLVLLDLARAAKTVVVAVLRASLLVGA